MTSVVTAIEKLVHKDENFENIITDITKVDSLRTDNNNDNTSYENTNSNNNLNSYNNNNDMYGESICSNNNGTITIVMTTCTNS